MFALFFCFGESLPLPSSCSLPYMPRLRPELRRRGFFVGGKLAAAERGRRGGGKAIAVCVETRERVLLKYLRPTIVVPVPYN